MVASKMWDDVSCSSKSFSLCSMDFSQHELNMFERIFCSVLKFQLFLNSSDYKNTYYNLKKLWVCLQLDEQGNIVGWKEENISVQPDQSKWSEWGIPQLQNKIGTQDIKQVKNIT